MPPHPSRRTPFGVFFRAPAAFAALGGALVTGCGPDTAAPAEAPVVPRPASADVAATQEGSLPKSERAYMWELEHGSNLLGKYGFAGLRDALRRPDADALRRILAPDFRATLPDASVVTRVDTGLVSAERRTGEGPPKDLTAEGFVAYLLEQRARMTELDRGSLGVMKINPVVRADPDCPWFVHALVGFSGRTDDGRVDVQLHVDMEIVRPTEESLVAPGWLRAFHVRELEIAVSHGAVFQPVTAEIGIDTRDLYDNWTKGKKFNLTGGVYACDYDRDSCLDLLVMDVNSAANRLLAGRPDGVFVDVTDRVGLGGLRDVGQRNGHAVIADLDGDGWEDVLLPSGHMWRNVGGQSFERVDRVSNFRALTGGDTFSQFGVETITIADYDCDGRVDLYVQRMCPPPLTWLKDTVPCEIENQLLRNLGDWQFDDVTAATGTPGEGRTPFTTVWFHANEDRWPDLYVPHEFGDGVLYVNQAGERFEKRDASPGTTDFGTMGACAGDVDGDGRADLYLASMYSKAGRRLMNNLPEGAYPPDITARFGTLIDGSELYRNDGDLNFTAIGVREQVHDIGWAWGPLLADFDGDGRLDLFAPAGYMSRDRDKPDG